MQARSGGLQGCIQDPLKAIDWEHVLDPDLSQAKNLSLLEQRYGIRAEEVSGRRRRGPTPPGGTVTNEDAFFMALGVVLYYVVPVWPRDVGNLARALGVDLERIGWYL